MTEKVNETYYKNTYGKNFLSSIQWVSYSTRKSDEIRKWKTPSPFIHIFHFIYSFLFPFFKCWCLGRVYCFTGEMKAALKVQASEEWQV